MKITGEWLKEKSACSEGVDWFVSQSFHSDKEVLDRHIKTWIRIDGVGMEKMWCCFWMRSGLRNKKGGLK